MSKKNLKIKNLSKYRYLELKYLCLQYNDLKSELKELSQEDIKAVQITGMPSARNISNEVQEIVIKKSEVERKIKAIEQSALGASPDIYEYMIKAVTEEIPFEFLSVPCGRRQFYEKRRLFFTLLDKKI